MRKYILIAAVFLLGFTCQAMELTDDLITFAENMENCYGVPKEKVENWLSEASFDETALRRMDRQTESRGWGYYKPLFVTDAKSMRGLMFYMDNEQALIEAEKRFNVSRFVIAAILGVETDYGKFQLKHRALDTLATLAFYYPRRSEFFTNELKMLMILSDEEENDAAKYLSSYAGAVGMPQFMPSNIKKYGVDFDGDGKIDIVNSVEDAIGSVARYLKAHGFRLDRPTAVKADVTGDLWQEYANRGMKPKIPVEVLQSSGVIPSVDVLPERKASFYELKLSEEDREYWLFFDNFYSITRYNPSVRYALAVTLLAFDIKELAELSENSY